jgi:hypothetical protein
MHTSLKLIVFSVLGALASSVGGCAGHTDTEVDDGTEVSDAKMTSSAISSPDPAAPSGGSGTSGEPGERADHDDDHDHGDDHGECKGDGDHEKHHHHRHHRFHVLDALDGTKDNQITIASLPAGLPPRLIARLHEIDANGDGIVTKDEAKAWFKAHRPDHGKHR